MVPTGALLGLDAVSAAAEGTIHSVNMVTRKPVKGLLGAPYLTEHKIAIEDIKEPLKIFDGSAREAGDRLSGQPQCRGRPVARRHRAGQDSSGKSGPIRR